MEVVQTRLAVSQPGTYSGIADALAKIVRLEGPRALFRGLTPTMIGILPYAGVRHRCHTLIASMCHALTLPQASARRGHATGYRVSR